jgi:hypothetical protein
LLPEKKQRMHEAVVLYFIIDALLGAWSIAGLVTLARKPEANTKIGKPE